MYLSKIALRNLFRRSGRTLIIAGVLAFAIFFAIILETFMAGMMEMSFSNIIDFDSAHLQIARPELFADNEDPLDHLFTPTEEVLTEIEKLPGFVATTPVLDFSANMLAGREEYPVRVRAAAPASFKEVFRYQDYLIEGDFLQAGDSGLVIGMNLAEILDLQVGDFYTLLFREEGGSLNTIQGEILGIAATPEPGMNLGTVIIDQSFAASALGVSSSEINQLKVKMTDRHSAVARSESLEKQLTGSLAKDFQVNSWRDVSDMLVAMEVWGQLETYFIVALILLVGAIGIINVVVLSSLERVEEIGMMKAMGLSEKQIVKIFSIEASGLGVIGGLIGAGLGAVGTYLLVNIGFDLQLLYGDITLELGIPILGTIYGVWKPQSFIIFFTLAVTVALISSLIPSYWAARKDPVDAIYHR